jgi:D-cysteine desulfhydrase
MNIEDIKKIQLGYYPTPLEKMENLTKLLGKGDLYIKRDDMTGPAFGGNKTRKLEYLMKDALDQGATAVVTFGGPQTNHGRTTVGAAVKLGLKPILIVGGKDTGYLSGNLTLDAIMGTDIYFVEDGSKIKEVTEKVIKKYEAQGDKVYVVPVGGSNYLGAVGYIMCVKEILGQMREKNIKIDHLVCAVGSMGTYTGLLLGTKYFDAPFDVIAVPVAPVGSEKENDIVKFANEISKHYDMGVKITAADIKIAYGPADAPYSGERYNKPDPITRETILLLGRTEGIMLDPTYTGKSFRGFVGMVKEGKFIKDGESAMFIHTGGAMALWTKEHLDDMQKQLHENCHVTQY